MYKYIKVCVTHIQHIRIMKSKLSMELGMGMGHCCFRKLLRLVDYFSTHTILIAHQQRGMPCDRTKNIFRILSMCVLCLIIPRHIWEKNHTQKKSKQKKKEKNHSHEYAFVTCAARKHCALPHVMWTMYMYVHLRNQFMKDASVYT